MKRRKQTKMNEKEIIKTCLNGSVDAFETLVEHYQSRVIALAWNILGDPDEAKDTAQDTFIQAFKNLHRFDMKRNFKTWLMGITVKRAIDRIRKQKSFLKFFKHLTENANFHIPANIHRIEDTEIFYPLLKILTEKERAAVTLKINDGYSAREIGAILNCSEATARVYLFKAKKKLKKALSLSPETGAAPSLARCSNDL
jgi:RNA polymerase sigma-70 factor (ECF subfamily)